MLDDIRTSRHAQRLVGRGTIRVRVDWATWRFSVVSRDRHRIDLVLSRPIAEAGGLR
jgi:hypothetical protein